MMSVAERFDTLKNKGVISLNDFKVVSVTRAKDFILIKATINKFCHVFFAFYENFIVCSGDYGEWVFDCTWETAKNQLPESLHYLFSKLSHNAKAITFDKEVALSDLEELLNELREYASDVLSSQKLVEFYSILESFSLTVSYSEIDENRICSVLDDYISEITDYIDLDSDSICPFYHIGEVPCVYLMQNLAMLDYIRKENVLFDTEKYKEDL